MNLKKDPEWEAIKNYDYSQMFQGEFLFPPERRQEWIDFIKKSRVFEHLYKSEKRKERLARKKTKIVRVG